MVRLARVRTEERSRGAAPSPRRHDRRWRRGTVGTLLLATLSLPGCPTWRTITPPAPAAVLVPCTQPDCLRVLTWNLHAIPFISPRPPARLRNVAAKIREQRPDVVLLQEVWSHAYAGELVRALEGDYRLTSAGGCTRPFPCGGLVVLVRIASGWIASAPTFVPYEASAPWYRFREWDGIVKKGALLLWLGRGDETLGIIDTHLQTEYPYHGYDYSDVRRRQLAQLELILHTTFDRRPVILGGDFNTSPIERSGLYGSHIVRLGDDRTADERAACHCGTRPPGPIPRTSPRWIDYVLTNELPARATTARVTNQWLDQPYSDHDGVLVRLDYDRGTLR